MLLTFTRYRNITGDTDTTEAVFASAAPEAQSLLEDALGRVGLLESATRTELLDIHDGGLVYPTAVPVTDAGDLRVINDTVHGATADLPTWIGLLGSCAPAQMSLTYTGGWTSETAPAYMLADLAWATHQFVHFDAAAASAIPAGATSASVGDVSASFGAGGAPGSGGPVRIIVWSAQTMRHRATGGP